MSNNFFAQDDEESEFRDMPDEVGGQEAPPANVRPPPRPAAPIPQPQIPDRTMAMRASEPEEVYEEETEEEEDFSTILTDARFRLEQGRLYEMIMNEGIFGDQADNDKAAKYVTKQIRNFAKEQMEIMLGMRQETPKVTPFSAADFPFNDAEVEALKNLAYVASKGATAAPEAQQFSGMPAPVKPMGINPISIKPKAAPVKPVVKSTPMPVKKSLAQKPTMPVKRRNEQEIEHILAEEGISREEYERTFNPDYVPLNKPLGMMSEAEIKERNRQIALRSTKQVKNPAALPMPSSEQEEMLHTARAQQASANPQMQSILNLLHNQPKKN